MSLLSDITAKIDQNGDGKLNKDDLEAFRSGDNGAVIDQLKERADQNGDGMVNLDDLKSVNFGDMVNDAKSALGGIKDKFFKS